MNVKEHNTADMDEASLRKLMKADGLTEGVIDELIKMRKELFETRGQKVNWISVKKDDINPIPLAACTDMGVENGWSAWQGDVGTANNGSQTWTPPSTVPAAPNFLLNTAGNIPCTPGPTPPPPPNNGPIPLVAPGFGSTSIQMGVSQTAGCVAEMLTFPLTVTAQDTNFVYAYAILIQDAGHSVTEQPFVDLCIKDQNGNQVPCGCFRYTGGPNLPGFYPAQNTCGFATYYKPWTLVGVNLSAYIGQTLTVTILNVDCAQCGHYAQSYWDFACGTLSGSMATYCPGQQTTMCGPIDPLINYTYQWYQNGNPYTGPPSATSQCITPIPQPGDTFVVEVQQPSGCNFSLVYVPQPVQLNPAFTYTVNCGTVTFTDNSSVSPVGSTTISGWNWSFPGGSPASSTVQNPTIAYPAAGNYTVTLIVTSANGCADTVSQVVNVLGLPVAAFSSTTVCVGNSTQFTDGSTPAPGDPIVGWNWSFPGGNPATSNSQNPSVTYSAAGNYTATLTVTSQQGCTSTFTQVVTVNPTPVANFTAPNVCFNNITQFTDLSSGPATQWAWNFGDGNTSTVQNPSNTYSSPGTYTVTLVVTNSSGCTNTFSQTVIVHPLPLASFSSTTVCFGDTTCFTDMSTIASGIINGWSWNFGDPSSPTNISNLQNPCHVFSAPGSYSVTLTVTSDSGCQSTAILPVAFSPPPVANFTGMNVCLNATTQFNDLSASSPSDPVNSWNWNFGDGNTASSQNPTNVYSSAGNYTVTLIVTTVMGCKDTIQQPVTVYNPPVANFSGPDSGCAPVCVTFTDLSTSIDGTISSWLWTFNGGSPATSTSSSPYVCWNTPGTYGVTLEVTSSYGCKDSITINPIISVYPWPNADFCVSPIQAPVTEPIINFCDQWSPDVTSWTWNFGDGSNPDSTNTDPVHSYSAIATNNDFYTFNVCINVQNQYGCWDTICKVVELIPEFTFFIPNAFTPNGDAVNELFFGKSRGVKEYNIWIFDRWGNLIWACDYEGKNTDFDNTGQDGMSAQCKWNGKVEGGFSDTMVQEDVYVWKVKLLDIFDKKHTYIGHVSVVK